MSEDHDDLDPTLENRVYLFRDLARAFIEKSGDLLASPSEDDRARALHALSLLAFASAVVSDPDEEDPEALARRIARGP